MAKSRLAMRKEAEAAEALGLDEESTKKSTKKAAKKTTKKTTKKSAKKSTRKTARAERKRLSWGIFSSTAKEEARFSYDQREAAEEKLAALLARGKRLYFLQPIKEPLSAAPVPETIPADEEEDEVVKKVVDPDAEDDDDAEVEETLPSEGGDFSAVGEEDEDPNEG